jgi:hypothetical protein
MMSMSELKILAPEQKIPEQTESLLVFLDELDLSRVEDLELFLESAEDVYTDAAQYKKLAQAEGYRRLSFDDVQGEEIFDTLFSLLKDLQLQIVQSEERIVEKKQPVTDAQVARMQRLYDNMILLRNVVRDTYGEEELVPVESTLPVADKSTQEATMPTEEKAAVAVQENTETAKEDVRVCGVPVPEAGISGIAAARTLREVLLTQRDRHEKFIINPQKQLLVDKLVRVLSSVPPVGLSFAEAAEVQALAKNIAVPEPMVATARVDSESLVQPLAPAPVAGAEEGVDERDLYNTSARKVMEITPDDTEQTIEIIVAEKTKARIEEQAVVKAEPKPQPAPILTQPVVESPREPDRAPLAEIERHDVINAVVPKSTHHVIAAAPELAEQSLTRQYLSDPEYQEFIAAYYTSATAFERMLDTTITQIEARTVDAFARWLREEQKSPFVVLEPLLVTEVIQLSQSRDIRVSLLEENIKYETFLAWVDLIPEMQSVVGAAAQMKFGELFARYMIESEMIYRAQETAG